MKYVVAKYLRISAEDIDLDGFDKYESNSIANQRALLDDFIARTPEFAGCEIIEALDDGRTGTNFQRLGVQSIIEMAQSGAVNCVIVKDLSRWGRNYLEVGDFLEQKFPAWGVRFISINDSYDSANFAGTTGGIDIAFRNLIYEMYSHDLSEKNRSAKISMAKSGKNSNAEVCYGYIKAPDDPRKLAIDEPAAEIVRRVFDLAAQGMTSTNIAKTLNDEKVPTPQERKAQLGSRHRWTNGKPSFWYSSVICLILRDERYIGNLVYGKTRIAAVGQKNQIRLPKEEWIVIPGAVPAIVTEEQFAAARANIDKRSSLNNGRVSPPLLFTRKIRCGCCGMALKADRRKHDVKYYCGTVKLTDKYSCKEFCVFENDITDAVLAALQQQIAFADGVREKLNTKAAKAVPTVEKLNAEIERLERLAEKSKTTKMDLWEKYHGGRITAEVFQRENEKSDEQARRYAAKIPEIRVRIRNLEAETGRENLFVERYGKHMGLTALTREVVEEFIHEVRVFAADRIEIVFNYADEFERIAKNLE